MYLLPVDFTYDIKSNPGIDTGTTGAFKTEHAPAKKATWLAGLKTVAQHSNYAGGTVARALPGRHIDCTI
jgi:hypothetical protein